MNSLKFLLTALVLLTVACTQKSATENTNSLTPLENEKWWGGVVNSNPKMPFGNGNYSNDLYADLKGNQGVPLYISNKGRYIWSEESFAISISPEIINVSNAKGTIISGQDGNTLKDAFRYASKQFFPPSGKTPDPLLFTNPQYNTWIELQYNQNQEDILKYAKAILDNGFPAGVLMIDDNWQDDYGTWEFSGERFSDPKAMMDQLHAMGFKLMLWVAPFVSPDSRNFRLLNKKKVFMFTDKEKTKTAMVEWWNGYSGLLDLSNPEAVKWYKSQLQNLVDKYKVDGFKFDAGDAEFYKGLYSFGDVSPNVQCELHAKLGLDFPLNELRACWKLGGQPIAQRLRDKQHNWKDLQALVPDMIALGLMGHSFGCPDMIGGGEFSSFQDSSIMDEELVVRSAQVSALMPMMQFSVAPWRILSKENLKICKNMAELHSLMGKEILKMAEGSAVSGEPIVRAMEYVYPGKGYELITDQFMLGDSILVAPVVTKGQRSREVVFPEGKWKAEDGAVLDGGKTQNVEVPVERLPWFRKI
jgi:alpha-glucosidase